MSVRIVIPGKPHGKSRPRFGNGRAFIDPKALAFAERVHIAWREARSPFFGHAPLTMRVSVHRRRPNTHFRKDGALTTLGIKAGIRPVVTPDADNFAGTVTHRRNQMAEWRLRQNGGDKLIDELNSSTHMISYAERMSHPLMIEFKRLQAEAYEWSKTQPVVIAL